MTRDADGRISVAGHARRNVWRMESVDPKAQITVLADSFEGKKLNSPNDLVYHSDGSLYFTDPPFGLETQRDDDPKKELKFNGVYKLSGGKLTLLYKELSKPNGILFSPDEKYLYVGNSDPEKKIWISTVIELETMVSTPNRTLNSASLLKFAL